jgi:hypothetical protein
MHPLFRKASAITHDVIGAAVEVHKDKGPGLLESIYQWCLTRELQWRGHSVQEVEKVHPIHKAQLLSYRKRLDIPLGLVINFHALKRTEGVSRLMVPGANLE